jgi:diguanylate cyclase (GGDEF)-like protein
VQYVSRLKEWVFQEPQNKNVSPKAVVVLRTSSLLFICYLLCAGVGFAFMRMPYLVMFAAMFLVLYAYTLYCSYQDRIQVAYVLLNMNTLVWVAMFYVFFGESIGVQHFFYALIFVDLLLIRKHTIVLLLSLYALRVLLYVNNIYSSAIYSGESLPHGLRVFMYVLSLVLEGAIVLFDGVYFTKDAFQMESRLQEYNDELRQVASTDPLTKVWNRFRMLEYVQKCLRRCRHGDMSFLSLAIGDIDFFKHVNDTYGHECGDAVLTKLAEVFQTEMEGHGAVARWGGEEFLFLFEDLNGDDALMNLSRIQMKVNKLAVPYEDQIIYVTMTFGLTEYDWMLSVDENIKEADDKLYRGKQTGRDRIIY